MGTTSKGFRGHVAAVVGLSLLGFGFLFYVIFAAGQLPLPGASPYELKAVLPSAGSMAPGARVTMAGLEVGKVSSVERKGVGTIVGLKITDERVSPIASDSRAQLRVRTPVGENYVSIEPGRARKSLPGGSVLPLSQADEPVDIDEVLSILRGPARDGARKLIQGTGGSLAGRGRDLNQLLEGTSNLLDDGSRAVRLLHTDRERVSRLVENLGDVAAELGEREADIETLARGGRTTFQAIADRDDSLRRLLKELPPTLVQARTTTRTVSSVTDRATPVLVDLGTALRDVRPAVRSLRPAAEEGRKLVAELGATAPGLETTLASARMLSKPAPATLDRLRKTLCQVNPATRYLKPYAADLTSFLGGLGSSANSYDAQSHLLRVVPILSENSLAGLPDEQSEAAQTLLRAGLLSQSTALDFDPYPKPGMIGKTVAKEKGTLGPEAVPATGYKYPRIMADC